jgi:hypothetical protein
MVGFRLSVEMLAYQKVQELIGVTFPVKFTDRLRQLNRRTTANAAKSNMIAWLTDLMPALAGPVFSTLADRKVDLFELVKDDDALAEHIRDNVAGMFHVAGTCRMGAAADPDAVVDGKRVRLRLARGRRLIADGAARHQHSTTAGREDFGGDGQWLARRTACAMIAARIIAVIARAFARRAIPSKSTSDVTPLGGSQ